MTTKSKKIEKIKVIDPDELLSNLRDFAKYQPNEYLSFTVANSLAIALNNTQHKLNELIDQMNEGEKI